MFQAEGKVGTFSFLTLKMLINPSSVLMAILHSLTLSSESIPSHSPLSGLPDFSAITSVSA